jgi:membrane-bound metal-dependent hydrolase YbcI (DUF457 family)
MMGRTHAAVGANVIWLTLLYGQVDDRAMVLLGMCALAALLPDIDAGAAQIHFLFSGVFSPLRNTFQHRGFFHSFLAAGILYLICHFTLRSFYPIAPEMMVLAYLSHPLIDAFNGGVRYLFPKKTFVTFIPQWLRFRVGSAPDQVLFVLSMMGVILFISSQLGSMTLHPVIAPLIVKLFFRNSVFIH